MDYEKWMDEEVPHLFQYLYIKVKYIDKYTGKTLFLKG